MPIPHNTTPTHQPRINKILRPILERQLLLRPYLPQSLEQHHLPLPDTLPPNPHVGRARRVDEPRPVPRALGVDDGCPGDPEAVERRRIRRCGIGIWEGEQLSNVLV